MNRNRAQNPTPPKNTSLLPCRRLVGAWLLLTFFSCAPLDRFSEYRGVNLLEGKSLSLWTANTEAAYMLYEPAGATAGHNATEAFRLRTVNLFPNGDFESAALTGWSLPGGTSFRASTTVDPIQGTRSLHFSIAASTHYISFPLSSLTDGFLLNTAYTFRFNVNYLVGSPLLSFDLNNIPSDSHIHVLELTRPTVVEPYYQYPEDFGASALIQSVSRQDPSPWYFVINTAIPGRGEVQVGMVDSIRFLRNDRTYRIRLVLPQHEPGRLPLPSGSYRFSFYVRQDPLAGSNNIFPASRISFGIGNTAKAEAASAAWSNWTLVTGTFHNLQIDPDSTLELWISATDSASDFTRDSGSILISSPSLEFLSD